MNTRTTLLLVLVLAAVGAFVVWDHYKGRTTEQRETFARRILDFDPADITGVDLVRRDATINLVKTGDHWNLQQPLAARADAGAVRSILDELEFAERLRTLTREELKGVSDADYGLDAPRYRVTLHGKKRPIGLLVGQETPTKDALYVRVEGRPEIHVTRKSVEDRLNLSLDDLRSRQAIEFLPAAATRLEIKTDERVLELTKGTAGWTLTRPLVARADQTKVSELLSDLSALRIQDFLSEDPKDVHTYRLADPVREITVFVGDAGKTLLIGPPLTNDASKVSAKLKAGNSIVTLSAEAAGKFALQLNDLRDARVLVFNTGDVAHIELLRNGEKIALDRKADGRWEVTEPVRAPGDVAGVNSFLVELGSLRAARFVADLATDLDRYGLATPALTASFYDVKTNLVAQLLVGGAAADGDIRFVKNAEEPFIYGLPARALDKIPGDYGALRSRRIFDLQPEQITQLEAGAVRLARGATGAWELVEPAQGALDADSVRHLVDLLSQLRAEHFGRPKADEDAGLGFTIRATAGEITHWLAIAPDGHAAADVCELTFQLAPAVVQTLTKQLVTTPEPVAPQDQQ